MKKALHYICWLLLICSLAVIVVSCSAAPAKQTPSAPLLSSQIPPTKIFPPTDQFEYQDQFMDGFIARIPIKDANNASPEEVVRILVTQRLEHYKTQSKDPAATIKDYTLDGVTLEKDTSYDPFYEIVAWVRFSIIPAEIPSDWASYPGSGVTPNDPWWHIEAPYGVFKDNGFYRLRVIFGWGT